MFGKRILALIPHPDDEVVGAAMAIRRAVSGGAKVFGLDLTHGCPPHKAGAGRIAQRRREAEAAARELGLTRIADEGLPARGLCGALPAAYLRVEAALAEYAIDTLWVPAYEGAHADHDCANALGAAAQRARPGLAVWEFAEYNNASGSPHANRFPGFADGVVTLDLADVEEGRWKSGLLALYRSESFNLRNVTGSDSFRESFRPLPRHDYSKPPHKGRLFYERFHWVPFRVPQIDFTTSAEVSAAIVAFLGATTSAATNRNRSDARRDL